MKVLQNLREKVNNFFYNEEELIQRIKEWDESGWITPETAASALKSLAGKETKKLLQLAVRISVYNSTALSLIGGGSLASIIAAGLTQGLLSSAGLLYILRDTIGHSYILNVLKKSKSKQRVAWWYHILGSVTAIKELARTHPEFTKVFLAYRNTRQIHKKKNSFDPDSFMYRIYEQKEWARFNKGYNSITKIFDATTDVKEKVEKAIKLDPKSKMERKLKRQQRRIRRLAKRIYKKEMKDKNKQPKFIRNRN